MTDAAAAALAVVKEQGWYVFRLQIRHNQAVCNGGLVSCKIVRPIDPKGLGGWRGNSSNEPEVVGRWDWSLANAFGIDCGKSGLVVVDQDPGTLWPYTETRIHRTGRGQHYIYEDPLGLGNRTALQPWGVDVKAVGGMVIGPGSWHPHGGYEVARDVPPAIAPPVLVNAARQSEAVGSESDPATVEPVRLEALDALTRLAGVYRRMQQAQQGERNDLLNKLSGTAASIWVRVETEDQTGELSADQIKATLLDAVPDDGDVRKSRATIESGWSYGLSHPVRDQYAIARNLASLSGGFDDDVAKEAHRLRVQEAARQLVARERTGKESVPQLIGLPAFLAEPDDYIDYRVQGLWPSDGRVLLAAQHKAGKTTLTGNLVRSLVDGDAFMDSFAVAQAARVIVLDDESSPRQMRRWLGEQGIRNASAVHVSALRGRLSTFNPLDAVCREQWGERLGRADALIFDCLRPVLDALGLSEDKDAGRFLEALDELAALAGIRELFVVHHMGHANERSRGDSRILDWPDAIWKLVREHDDPTSTRYFSAYGRDVDQPEIRLAYNPLDRHLSVNGGSRKAESSDRRQAEIVAFIEQHEDCGQNAIERAIGGDRNEIRKVLRQMAAAGVIAVEKRGTKHMHRIVENA